MTQCPKCKSDNIVSVQYGYVATKGTECHYDGISEYECKDCGYRQGRWSGKELKDKDHEPPYGKEHRSNCPVK